MQPSQSIQVVQGAQVIIFFVKTEVPEDLTFTPVCMSDFYVYTYLREDGSVYYVGKGSGRRAYSKTRNCHLPTDRTRIHTFPMTDEETAFAYERYLIDFYGRKDIGTGILRNMTDGGDGSSGHVVSETNRQKLRERMLGKRYALGIKYSPESNALKSKALKGIPKSPEHIKKMSENAKRHGTAHLHTPEVEAKKSASLMGHAVSEKTKEAVSKANTGRKWTPERRAARSQWLRENHWRRTARIPR